MTMNYLKNSWYVGQGSLAPLALWDGEKFVTVGGEDKTFVPKFLFVPQDFKFYNHTPEELMEIIHSKKGTKTTSALAVQVLLLTLRSANTRVIPAPVPRVELSGVEIKPPKAKRTRKSKDAANKTEVVE